MSLLGLYVNLQPLSFHAFDFNVAIITIIPNEHGTVKKLLHTKFYFYIHNIVKCFTLKLTILH